jgi:murein DD-endopeptidase MepM/ murein hydrolase activator NlpD
MPSLEQDVDVIEAAATARTYTVVAGDTLTRIAARTGVSVSDLVAFNQLADPNRIEVGQILRLDAHTPPTPTPPAPSDDTSAAARLHWGDPIREWSDEFDYTGRPDPDKWKLPPAEGWPGHAGHGHRRPENVTVADGMMILVAKPNGDAPWVMSKFDTRFMRVEVRSRSMNTGRAAPRTTSCTWSGRRGTDGRAVVSTT